MIHLASPHFCEKLLFKLKDIPHKTVDVNDEWHIIIDKDKELNCTSRRNDRGESILTFTFEWDKNKNKSNRVKHKVSFEEAETVFFDDNALYLFDNKHSSATEERFIVIGVDTSYRELTVCHCHRGKDEEIIRIISAREANNAEIKLYYGRF